MLVATGFLCALVAWSPSQAPQAWVAFVGELVIVVLVAVGRMSRATQFAIPAALLISGLAIEAIRAPALAEAPALLRSYLALILLFFIYILADGAWATRLILAALVVGCAIASSSIVYLWSGDPHSKISLLNESLHGRLGEQLAPRLATRVEPPNLNAAAFLVAPLVPLAFVGAVRTARFVRLGSTSLMFVLLAIVVLMSGRASWLGTAAGLLVAASFFGRRVLLVTSLFGVAGVAGLAALTSDTTLGSIDNVVGRVELWRFSIATLMTTFPFGTGLGMFPHILAASLPASFGQPPPTTPHNSWIQLAGDAGVLGITASVVGLLQLARGLRGVRSASPARQAALAALVCYGSIGVFESLVVFTQPVGPQSFVSVASPIPWLLLAIAERERIASREAG